MNSFWYAVCRLMAAIIVVVVGCLLTPSGLVNATEVDLAQIATQQALTPAEQKLLQRAIEDYQFQEQSKSIARLNALLKIHPTNLEILHYLGLSYEETRQYVKAQGAYALWLRYSGDRMDDDARFAWVGMAKSYDKTNHTPMGIKLLRRWVAEHPDDYDTTIALGDMLVRQKLFGESKALFHQLLAKKDVPISSQSSAHYYLGYEAWLEGDVPELELQGRRMLRVDPESGFASVIKQLMETPPPRRLGLNATIGVDAFYVDNVESKPTYRIATKGNSRTTGINTALGLTWNFRHHLAANYNFGGTFYSKRPDLDIGLHMLGVTWAKDGVQFGPRYEFVSMYNKLLYKGIGADLGWGIGKWMMIESVRNKTFGRTVKVLDAQGAANVVNLAYLSGWNNSLMVMRQASWGQALWILGANWVVERTHGNATVDRRLSDFGQLGGSMSVMYPNDTLLYTADINGYIKKYRGVDAALLNAKRKDEYIHLGAGLTWTPAEHKKHSLSLKAEWNNNASNYDFPNNSTKAASAAAYSQWKQSVGYNYTW